MSCVFVFDVFVRIQYGRFYHDQYFTVNLYIFILVNMWPLLNIHLIKFANHYVINLDNNIKNQTNHPLNIKQYMNNHTDNLDLEPVISTDVSKITLALLFFFKLIVTIYVFLKLCTTLFLVG